MTTKRPIDSPTAAPIPFKNTTLLLICDCQYGYRHPTHWGNGASTPQFEDNIKKLLTFCRANCENRSEEDCAKILHTQFRTVWTDSPLHRTHKGPYGANGEEKRGIDHAEYAVPRTKGPDGPRFLYQIDEWHNIPGRKMEDGGTIVDELDTNTLPCWESFMTKHGHGPFVNSGLLEYLKAKGIRTLVIAGMETDQVINLTVQTAFNYALVGNWGGIGNAIDANAADRWTDDGASWKLEDVTDEHLEYPQFNGLAINMARIIVVSDATRAFGKGKFDAQTVHDVALESLKPYAELRTTEEIVAAFGERQSR